MSWKFRCGYGSSQQLRTKFLEQRNRIGTKMLESAVSYPVVYGLKRVNRLLLELERNNVELVLTRANVAYMHYVLNQQEAILDALPTIAKQEN
jgi:hypothetical protein